jgi:hypothetical protein
MAFACWMYGFKSVFSDGTEKVSVGVTGPVELEVVSIEGGSRKAAGASAGRVLGSPINGVLSNSIKLAEDSEAMQGVGEILPELRSLSKEPEARRPVYDCVSELVSKSSDC